MNPIRINLEQLKNKTIPIGREGENEYTVVRIDCGKVFREHPQAEVSMKVKPPKGIVYPVTVAREGNEIIWTVKDYDLASKGDGQFQLTFTDGTVICKTAIGRTLVLKSLEGNGPAPTPIDDWMQEAQEALDAVEDAEVNQPIIGVDGYWYTWNQEAGEYQKTDTKAQGEAGPQGPAGPQGETGPQGPAGDPTTLIDDTSTAADKAWSAAKSNTLLSGLTSMNTATAADVGKALSPKTVNSGKVTEWQFKPIEGGSGEEIKSAKLNISDCLFAENKYYDNNLQLSDLEGYNVYKIPVNHADFVTIMWNGDNPFGVILSGYYYTFEDTNGLSRNLTAANYKEMSNKKKVAFIAPANAVAIYFTLKADRVSGTNIVKNSTRDYVPQVDIGNNFIIPVDSNSAVNAQYYLRVLNGANNIYDWTNADYITWWIHVNAGDTMNFINAVPGLNYNALFIDEDDTITQITTLSKTFTKDATVCVFEKTTNPNNTYIIKSGIKYKIDRQNVMGLENPFYGMSGVAFGTSLTYRALTTYGYLQYLPALSGITFDNQGIGSSRILGTGDHLDMLKAIKEYEGYGDKNIVILEGFVNDWYNNKTLGSWDDSGETTVCGCVRSALNHMLSQNANMTIFLVLDHYGLNGEANMSSTAKNASNKTQYEFYEEIAKVAESLGIPVIKEYAGSQISENTPQYITDYIHPNALGARQSANFIWSKMKEHMPNAIA